MSIEAYEVLLGGVNTQSFSEAVKYCQRGDIVINASELKELKTNLVEELMKSHHMSKENATLAIKKFDVDAIAKKFPYHVRHYPIEMLVEGIFRAYQRD
jgi:hypothetical protein